MNILLESRTFYPAVGGLEVMSQELAAAWRERGHDIRVTTLTPLGSAQELTNMEVIRRPSFSDFRRLLLWSDVFVQSGMSLRSLGPALFARRPRVFIHHNMLESFRGRLTARCALKRAATLLGHNIAVSKAVGSGIYGPTTHIPNVFRRLFSEKAIGPDHHRAGLLFVGRLVSVKGADLAIDALARLHSGGQKLSLRICGDGPERPLLQAQVRELQLQDYVEFTGWATPVELAEYYARAEVAIIPSRYEPFGIVALEAVASGCPVVAADIGGLPEAVGACGLLFEPDDAEHLSRAIQLARDPVVREQLRSSMREHLARHSVDTVAEQYLGVLRAVAA